MKITKITKNSLKIFVNLLGQVSWIWIARRTRRRSLSPFGLEWWHCDQSIACYQTSLHNESPAQLQKKDCQRLLWRKRWGARCWIERCILVWLNQILVAILLDQILESQVVLYTLKGKTDFYLHKKLKHYTKIRSFWTDFALFR